MYYKFGVLNLQRCKSRGKIKNFNFYFARSYIRFKLLSEYYRCKYFRKRTFSKKSLILLPKIGGKITK